MIYKLFTSESVCAGHPDKICDQISDAILDAAISSDSNAHTGIETLVTKNHVTVAGEVKVKNGTVLNYEKIIRDIIRDLGYTKVKFGFAVTETPNLMPLPITLAHKLVENLDKVGKDKIIPYLEPDGKSEVTIKYENGKPVSIERVVLAACHNKGIKNRQVKEDLFKYVVIPTLGGFNLKIDRRNFIVNGGGIWIIPGPATDTGVTGRKIMVDSYGAFARAGGGCFSGKDPTKVDRSGAYAARYIAKNIVAAGLADKVEVQLAYVIARKKPIAKSIETFGTEKVSLTKIEDFAWSLLDLSVESIIAGLDLLHPIYQKTATYGHFGRPGFSWERIVK